MDDSIIAIIAAAVIGLTQFVVSANKKKKEKERMINRRIEQEYYAQREEGDEEEDSFYMEDPLQEVLSSQFGGEMPRRMLTPEEEGGPMAKPVFTISEAQPMEQKAEEYEEEEEGIFLHDFTPKSAILFSEVINSRWNS